MSDGEYLPDGPLIDLAGVEWRDDTLPFELILVKPNSLPDPEPQPRNTQRCSEILNSDTFDNIRWNELDLDSLLSQLNRPPSF
ncbi:glutathione synthetase [Schistosoma japonicum]|uniref:Glutathione synthetase n=1 Tax=Schistosoma japonicum TaxID=6182 RepID=A0A4Z2DTU9_SCHJA|nr:glutathione synthetase [Schistosoma japonicum]